MNTIKAQTILDDATVMIGWDLNQMEERQKQMRRSALSLALEEVWNAWWWEVLMVCAATAAATVYSESTTYAGGTFVYYPANQKFYQALATTTGNAPAIYTNGSWTAQGEFWAAACPFYTADDFVEGTIYEVGSVVRNPVDGLYYQRTGNNLILTDGGSLYLNRYNEYARQPAAQYEVTVIPSDGNTTLGNGSTYENNGQIIWFYSIRYNPVAKLWVLCGSGGNLWRIYGTSPTLLGVYDTTYNTEPSGGGTLAYAPALSPSVDTLNWALLIPYAPVMDVPGKVRAIGATDPRDRGARCYRFEETPDGVRIPDWSAGVPWIWRRRPVPAITGDTWSSTAVYTATPTNQLSF